MMLTLAAPNELIRAYVFEPHGLEVTDAMIDSLRRLVGERFSDTRLLSVAEYVQSLSVIRKRDKEKCDKIWLRALQKLSNGE